MPFWDEVQSYYEKIGDSTTLLHHKESLNLVFSIDRKLIDDVSSKMRTTEDFIILYLVSVRGQNCPFRIYLGRGKQIKKVMFEYNHSAPLLEMDIDSTEGLKEWIDAVHQHLGSNVSEELIYVKGKLVKSKYNFDFSINGQKGTYPYSTYKRFLWFWQRKEIKTKSYQPWLVS